MNDETPSQTAGPYVHLGLPPTRAAEPEMALEGLVIDGAGEPLRDALIELWDASTGQWLRSETDADTGLYRFMLRQPRVPFVSLLLLARGITVGLHTRAYLAPAPGDALLARLGPRAATLQATELQALGLPGVLPAWRFDIRLQGRAGESETVFLDL